MRAVAVLNANESLAGTRRDRAIKRKMKTNRARFPAGVDGCHANATIVISESGPVDHSAGDGSLRRVM